MNSLVARWTLGSGLWLALWGLAFVGPLASAISVWYVNDTYNHCFLVLPASLYAIWQQRGAIFSRAPHYSMAGMISVSLCLIILAFGQAAHIDTLQHIAAFALLPSTLLLVAGWSIIRVILPPLLFIMFCVPVGEELIPLFQKITADIAITILNWLKIPVYRDGLYISVPNGHFVVAEACSGIRFFIACIVLGAAYAYLNFKTYWRAIVFILFTVILPIIANGIRAFGIIYIGHVTNMQHAVGADHLIFGWLFFAIVVAFMLLVGHHFSDGHRVWQNKSATIHESWKQHSSFTSTVAAGLPLLMALAINLSLENLPEQKFNLIPDDTIVFSKQEQLEQTDWAPRMHNADNYRTARDSRSGAFIYQAIYHYNTEHREMISWENRVYDIELWSLRGEYTYKTKDSDQIQILDLTSLKGNNRLLAYWYVVPGYTGSSSTRAKLQQALNRLLLRPSGGALVAVSLNYRSTNNIELSLLERILDTHTKKLSQY